MIVLELEMLQCGVETSNRHIYPEEAVKQAIDRFKTNNKPMFGCIGDNIPNTVLSFDQISHQVTDMALKGDTVIATLQVLNTSAGKIVEDLILSGYEYQLSPRMFAQLGHSTNPPTIKNIDFVSIGLVPKQ